MALNRFFNQPTRYTHPLAVFSQDPFFRQVLDPDFSALSATPAMDVVETDKEYVLRVNAPGYSKEQISVDVDGNNLIVKGTSSEQKEEEGGTWIRRERSESSFQRSVLLGPNIAPTKIKASLKDGVLQVNVPKDETKAQAKITIE